MSGVDVDTGLPVCGKYPSEVKVFRMDFTARLGDGVTLTAITSVTVTARGRVSGSSAVTVTNSSITGGNSQLVQFFLTGGTTGEDYTVVVLVTASSGETLQGAGLLTVREYVGTV